MTQAHSSKAIRRPKVKAAAKARKIPIRLSETGTAEEAKDDLAKSIFSQDKSRGQVPKGDCKNRSPNGKKKRLRKTVF